MPKRKKNLWFRWAAMAASFAFVSAICFFSMAYINKKAYINTNVPNTTETSGKPGETQHIVNTEPSVLWGFYVNNALIGDQQTYSLGNAVPEIVIEEGAYTTATSTPTIFGGSLISFSARHGSVCSLCAVTVPTPQSRTQVPTRSRMFQGKASPERELRARE